MDFCLIYFGTGIAVYCVLRLLFRKTGVGRKGLNALWWSWLTSGELVGLVFGPLLWPLVAVFACFWWIGEKCHLKSQRREAQEKAAAMKTATMYSHLSMDDFWPHRIGPSPNYRPSPGLISTY